MSFNSKAVLRVNDLQITFKDVQCKDILALNIETLFAYKGQSLAIYGASGSGKSTLLYAISGLLQLHCGKIIWNDVEPLTLSPAKQNQWRRANIGFVFQDFNLIHELSPLENVLLPVRFTNFSVDPVIKSRATGLMEQFKIPTSRQNTGQLSRGERQRLALARALIFDPPIILADEPTASLDGEAADIAADALCKLASDEGKTVIIVSHDEGLIQRCMKQVKLERGQIILESERSQS